MKAIVQTLSSYTFQINKGIQMNSKINPLKKAGYNYGNTLWGTGEGWGYFSPLTISGLGGNGYYAKHIDFIDNEQSSNETVDDEEVIYALAEDENDEDEIFPQVRKTPEMIHGQE